MAMPIEIDELRSLLRPESDLSKRAFSVLQAIALYVNDNDQSPLAREFVLRALECRHKFEEFGQILDALVREVGLYPYIDLAGLGVRDSIAYEYHRPDNMAEPFVFHREQAEVYRRLLDGDSVILSAPTSFGKSRIIDAIVASERHNNIAIIVPTIALIDETRRRLSQLFSESYKIITHLSQKPRKKNIFVFTAERVIAYEHLPSIDFFVIDEFYKIGALGEDEVRTVALNTAFYKLRKKGAQFYLLGPNIKSIPPGFEKAFRCYFYPTNYNTVVAEQSRVKGSGGELRRLVELASRLNEATLIYCRSPARVNEVARALHENGVGRSSPDLGPAADWVSNNYHPEWIFCDALRSGIGIHHGRLPRSLAQYVVRQFNELRLRFLICTSTLIEGVNTKAKNVIIFDKKIGLDDFDFFTFNNIKGRSGRMFEHFVGHVFVFHDPPHEQLPFVEFPMFTQDEKSPESLLIQLDSEDLKPSSSTRMKSITEQRVLPLRVLRENSTIDPDAQINLAKEIESEMRTLSRQLNWRQFPKYEQLETACRLIWRHLVPTKRRGGVRSPKELAFKTWQLRKRNEVVDRIRRELQPGRFQAKSADEAVEKVLQFDRTWAGFELPRYLMALSRIQEVVLSRNGVRPGNYSFYSAQVESLFRPPVLAALDEYGVPPQVGLKILDGLGSEEDLDIALSGLRGLRISAYELAPFEVQILSDAKAGL